VSGSKNTFTINCGIGKAQGAELLKIINRILSNQTDLKRFGDTLDEMLKGINDIRQSFAEQSVPHIQPEMVIDAVVSGSIKFHVSVLNISGTPLTDVRMTQHASVVRDVSQMLPVATMQPVTTILPSRGRVSVPGIDSTELLGTRNLRLAFTYKSKVNGISADFLSTYEFALGDGPLSPGVIDPRKFFEATGATLNNARAAMLDDINISLSDLFASLPKGTISFWTAETRDGGAANYITMQNDIRSFSYDPVMHIALLRAKPASAPLFMTFEPKDRHMLAFGWDETGPRIVSVDGESVTTPHSQ